MDRYHILRGVDPLKESLDKLGEEKVRKLGRNLTPDEYFNDPEIRALLIKGFEQGYKHFYPKDFFYTCDKCGRCDETVQLSRQNTQYADDSSNYVKACPECFKEIQDYWSERWDDYRAGY